MRAVHSANENQPAQNVYLKFSCIVYIHDIIIHEMLREKDKATEHNRKTKQQNTTRPRQLFFKEKTASGGIQTHDRPLARRSALYMYKCGRT